MAERETAETLFKFFTDLDPGDAAGEEIEINYASPGVVRRGLEASRMLMAIRQITGAKAAEPAAAPAPPQESAPANGAAQAELESARDKISETEALVDRLLSQNLELKEENESLKVKIGRLQKQVERLYSQSELASILGRIDTDKSKREPAAADSDPAAEASSAESEAPPLPDESKAAVEAESKPDPAA